MKWKKQATPLGRSWWVLGTPERRINDIEYGLLDGEMIPTMTREAKLNHHQNHSDGKQHGRVLGDFLHECMIPTLKKKNQKNKTANHSTAEHHHSATIGDFLFGTPTKSDYDAGKRSPGYGSFRDQLMATLIARDQKSGKTSRATMEKNSRPLNEQLQSDVGRSRSLGPMDTLRVGEWIMGFPTGWLAGVLRPMETQLFPKSQKRSEEP